MNKTQWQNLKNIGNYFNIIFAIVFMLAQNVNAQMFDDEITGVTSDSKPVMEQEKNSLQNQNNAQQRKAVAPNRPLAKQNIKTNAKPQNSTSAQNNVNINVRKVENNNKQNKDAKIYLFYRDYKVSRGLNGRTSCSMRFYVYSTVSEKITNISYRLKWPEIETSISFDNVEPNKPVYYDYALLGNGCYSMDTPPNIIVNRCRIKGYSQKYCSSIIQWTK